MAWAATYDSFGNVQIDFKEVTNNLRFPGQYYDAETGLHYNLNRYYDPNTGRYLSTDPSWTGLNLYAYVFNNPLSWIDPLGLCPEQSYSQSANIIEAYEFFFNQTDHPTIPNYSYEDWQSNLGEFVGVILENTADFLIGLTTHVLIQFLNIETTQPAEATELP